MQISCPQIRQRGHCLASPGAARTAPLPHGCSSAHQWMPHVPSQALTCAAGGDAIHQQLLMRHSGLVGVAPWQQAGTWRRLGSRPLAGMQARTRGDGSICCCQGKALGRACYTPPPAALSCNRPLANCCWEQLRSRRRRHQRGGRHRRNRRRPGHRHRRRLHRHPQSRGRRGRRRACHPCMSQLKMTNSTS